MSIYDYTIEKPDGTKLALKDFRGKVMLIVNTATGCGFTPQYKALESLYERYHDKGLEIIDIPCNQFGQTPETDEEIKTFCQLHYKTRFPQMKKAEVNGKNALPVYAYLKSCQGFKGFSRHKLTRAIEGLLEKLVPKWAKSPDIKWNFTKFLVDRQGRVIDRFEATTSMKEVEKSVKMAVDSKNT